jgi:hypothetical protein
MRARLAREGEAAAAAAAATRAAEEDEEERAELAQIVLGLKEDAIKPLRARRSTMLSRGRR